jgi:hypothetical protein
MDGLSRPVDVVRGAFRSVGIFPVRRHSRWRAFDSVTVERDNAASFGVTRRFGYERSGVTLGCGETRLPGSTDSA